MANTLSGLKIGDTVELNFHSKTAGLRIIEGETPKFWKVNGIRYCKRTGKEYGVKPSRAIWIRPVN
jgi:hypothetical protein